MNSRTKADRTHRMRDFILYFIISALLIGVLVLAPVIAMTWKAILYGFGVPAVSAVVFGYFGCVKPKALEEAVLLAFDELSVLRPLPSACLHFHSCRCI